MPELYGARRGRDILFGSRSQGYALDKEPWDESKVHRGQPENAGEFGPGGGGGAKAEGGEGGGKGSDPAKPAAASTGSSASGGPSGDPSGGEGSSSPGVHAHGPDGASAWRDKVSTTFRCETIDDLMTSSEKNQTILARTADKIARDLGLEFKNPGPKKRGPLEKKLAKPGKTPARITDAVRGGFNVTKPGQADAIAAGFAKAFPMADEGWAITNVGYFDRKLMVQMPNNQLAEIQIWEPSLLDAKEKKGGHDHYEKWRVLPPDDVAGHQREEAAMRAIYQPVLDALPPEWKAVTGSGGNELNALSKASGVSKAP